jgi:hypothetical protein
MRSFRLIAALVVASAFSMLTAAGASAGPLGHKHSGGSGKCRLSLIAEPHSITSGETVEVIGQLLCLNGSSEGQPVNIYGSQSHGHGVLKLLSSGKSTLLDTATTGAGGFFSFVDPSVTADTTFFARAGTVRSASKVVHLAPVVTLVGPSEKLPLFTGQHNRTLFKGTVSPDDVGAVVVLQRENATSVEEWHGIQLGVVQAGGVYELSHNFVVPGDANLRVIVRRHGVFTVRGISSTLSYGISQKQRPGLSINTTNYSTPYGTPVTLSGVLAAGAGKTVTLESRTAGNTFAPVATTTTTAGGEYKFPVGPLHNTAYQVTEGALKSAVLFEGVKYVLTVKPPASTVATDQPLTFEGTVTPALAGKSVYLERLNKLGTGFHVVDVGTVAAAGSFSITDFVFGPGSDVFRVKVPGDPDNQGIESALFPVTVTAAAPVTVKPMPQPKQPLEGTI